MDIGHTFARSLELLWKYKFLWLFGLVMGLTSVGGNLGSNSNYRFNGSNNPFTNQSVEPAVLILAVIVGFVLLVIFLVLFFYVRFVARGALVTTVRDVEAQSTPTLRDAWKSGNTFYTRLLGLGFLVNVPLVLVSILLILVAFIPLIGLFVSSRARLNGSPDQALAALGIAGVLAVCCAILCIFLLNIIIHPLYEFAVRAIVIQDVSVREGLRQGIQRAREHLGNVIVVYLLLIGARIGYFLVAAIIAIPIGLVVAVGMFSTLQGNVNALIILLLILAVPLWLLAGVIEGAFQIFESNVWTETYLALANK